jgi:glycerophosphoryl diester phosphodiesterase
LKTAVRILWITIICVIIFAAIFLIAGGGFGRKDAVLRFPGNQSILLFAHRGSGNYFPENSMEGFKAAAFSGFKAIETDIRLSKDDSLVIFHDDNCMRLLGINISLDSLSSGELKKSRILFNGIQSGSTVLMLEELFRNIQDSLIIYLDVKLHDTGTASKIVSLIKKHHLESSTIVANSNMFFIAWIEFHDPEINTVLEGFTPDKEWIYNVIPKKFKPDFFSSFASDVTPGHMDWLRRKGLTDRRIVYGVDKENFKKVLDAGIQKIIMDYDSTLKDEILKSQ